MRSGSGCRRVEVEGMTFAGLLWVFQCQAMHKNFHIRSSKAPESREAMGDSLDLGLENQMDEGHHLRIASQKQNKLKKLNSIYRRRNMRNRKEEEKCLILLWFWRVINLSVLGTVWVSWIEFDGFGFILRLHQFDAKWGLAMIFDACSLQFGLIIVLVLLLMLLVGKKIGSGLFICIFQCVLL